MKDVAARIYYIMIYEYIKNNQIQIHYLAMPSIEFNYQGTLHTLIFQPGQTDRKYIQRLISDEWGLNFQQFSLTYLDSDNDQITADIQQDFQVARVTMTGDSDLLKFHLNLNAGAIPKFKQKAQPKIIDPFLLPSQNQTDIISVQSQNHRQQRINQVPKDDMKVQVVQKIENEQIVPESVKNQNQIAQHVQVASKEHPQQQKTQNKKQGNFEKVTELRVSPRKDVLDSEAKKKQKEENEAKKKAETQAKKKAQQEAAIKKKEAQQAKKQAQKIKKQEKQKKQIEEKQAQKLKAQQKQLARKEKLKKEAQQKEAKKKLQEKKKIESESSERSADKKIEQNLQKTNEKVKQLKTKPVQLTQERVKQLAKQQILSMIPELKKKMIENEGLKVDNAQKINDNVCKLCNANLSLQIPLTFYFNPQTKSYLCSSCQSRDHGLQNLIKIRNPKHFQEIEFLHLNVILKNQLTNNSSEETDKYIQEMKTISTTKLKEQLKIKSNELKKAKQIQQKRKLAEEKKKQLAEQKRLEQQAKKLNEQSNKAQQQTK